MSSRPLNNMQAPLVNKEGIVIPPWNSFFQQFVQAAPKVAVITASPYVSSSKGTLIFTGAITITLTRGTVSINLNGQRIVPISIGDTVSWTGPATVQFLGA